MSGWTIACLVIVAVVLYLLLRSEKYWREMMRWRPPYGKPPSRDRRRDDEEDA